MYVATPDNDVRFRFGLVNTVSTRTSAPKIKSHSILNLLCHRILHWRRGLISSEFSAVQAVKQVRKRCHHQMATLTAPGEFDVYSNPNNVAERWSEWIKRLQVYVVAKGITDGKRAEAILLHCAGIDVHNLYDTIDPQKTGVRASRELRAATSRVPALNEDEFQVAVITFES